jgi:hypothetical protein
MLDLPLTVSILLMGPGTELYATADRAFRAARNTRKRLSLQHMQLLLHRSASVHNNERPRLRVETPWTKVGNDTTLSRLT